MGLKKLNQYWLELVKDPGNPHYEKLLWVSDSAFWDDDDPQPSGDIIDVILADEPDYIAFGDLRYVKQKRDDEEE